MTMKERIAQIGNVLDHWAQVDNDFCDLYPALDNALRQLYQEVTTLDLSKPKRLLTCACCGESAGRWVQHWNRDKGYGVCAKCVEWLRSRGESEEALQDLYGVEGVNWGHV